MICNCSSKSFLNIMFLLFTIIFVTNKLNGETFIPLLYVGLCMYNVCTLP